MPVIDNRYYIGLPLPGQKCGGAKECFDMQALPGLRKNRAFQCFGHNLFNH
jgi:hypothetical protein